MYKNCTVGVVVPAYNEEGFVGEVIRTLPAFVDRAYVVDDCSTDGTWEEIQGAARSVGRDGTGADGEKAGPLIETVRHDGNRGVGAAVVTGYRMAAADGVDVTAVMNGDGQMDPAILDRIVDPVAEDEADYAKGNRLFRRDHVEGMGAWRQVGNAALTFLTKVASGYWKTMDPQNGYTAISAEALAAIDLDALYEDYGFCNDVLVRLNARGMRVADVEMRAVYGEERSTIRYHRFIPSVSKLLLHRFLWRLKTRYLVDDFHPLVGLYLLGAVTTLLGMVGLTSSALSNDEDRDHTDRSVASSVHLTFLGLFSATGAMTLDMQENESLETQVRLTDPERDAAEGTDDAATRTDHADSGAGHAADGSVGDRSGGGDADANGAGESPTRVRPLEEGPGDEVADATEDESAPSTSLD